MILAAPAFLVFGPSELGRMSSKCDDCVQHQGVMLRLMPKKRPERATQNDVMTPMTRKKE
jgi:hypothetical protein